MFKTIKLNLKNKIFLLILKKFFLSITFVIAFTFLVYLILISLYPLPLNEEAKLTSNQFVSINLVEQSKEYNLDKTAFTKSFLFLWKLITFSAIKFSQVDTSIAVFSNNDRNAWTYFVSNNEVNYLIIIFSQFLSFIIGYLLGVWAGYKKRSYIDYLINFFSVLFLSTSLLIVIPIIIHFEYLFGIIVNYNPKKISTFLFPIVTIVLISQSAIVKIVRGETIKGLFHPSYTYYKSLGFSEWSIFRKSILKNTIVALLPLFPFLLVGSLSSSVFLETYFNIPGNWKHIYGILIKKEIGPICVLIYLIVLSFSISYFACEVIRIILNPFVERSK
ncbi:hypothetical protein VO56_00490 [Mycoplasmopsis gallinacea]|uniref:ABC transmembrane type-1 domain-containing protein n=1 Tax=Mycoplasmopsis gallinacea TaxID=29556 RepID=A0A0D5ZIY4_9BACT|nr:hypothetical protein VO56_00490 [Mycoplasmopsis gallinacea]